MSNSPPQECYCRSNILKILPLSNILAPGTVVIDKCRTHGIYICVKSGSHALPPPRRHNIVRCIIVYESMGSVGKRDFDVRAVNHMDPYMDKEDNCIAKCQNVLVQVGVENIVNVLKLGICL